MCAQLSGKLTKYSRRITCHLMMMMKANEKSETNLINRTLFLHDLLLCAVFTTPRCRFGFLLCKHVICSTTIHFLPFFAVTTTAAAATATATATMIRICYASILSVCALCNV